MTRADFARLMGVDRSATTRWVHLGLPTTRDGGIDPKIGRAWVKKHVDPTKRIYTQAARASAAVQARTSGRSQQPAAVESPEADPVSAAVRMTLVWLASKMPAAVAARAMEAGMSRAEAERAYSLVAAAAEGETRALFLEMSLPCPLHPDWSEWRHPGFEPMPEPEAA
jgi:hypothetical protein